MIVHDRFNPPGDPGLDCSGDPGHTMQEFRDEVDINRIMGRVLNGGQQLPPELRESMFGDFSEVGDFQEALQVLDRARWQFDSLPAAVRDRFKNDPGAFLAWVHDPGTTLDEANELGLLHEEARARQAAKKAELAAAEAAKQAQQPAVVVPAGGVVTSTLKTP